MQIPNACSSAPITHVNTEIKLTTVWSFRLLFACMCTNMHINLGLP